jgi:signal peptidase I
MSEQAIHRHEEIVGTLATEMLRSFGEIRSVVRGASMIPTMFPGDVVVVRRETASTARPGDVMLFFREGLFCAHRMVDKTREGEPIRLIARGDALGKNDPPFAEKELLGRVTAVIRRGKRIELDGAHSAASQRLLRWIVQRRSSSVKWILRWHFLRARLFPLPKTADNRVLFELPGAA